ncbi:MAG: endonuclease Q family protein [archaeon]
MQKLIISRSHAGLMLADLHIHSKYSRATSRNLDLTHLEKYARIKGIDLLGTGDFQHPEWQKELRAGLHEDGSGLLRTETGYPFVLSTEISLIYSQGGKGRRVHLVALAPDFDAMDQITSYLGSKGRLDYDGRPIFPMSCIETVEALTSISDDIEVFPAHIWTPWFSMFGSKSGFDSVEECFGDQVKKIHAIETGLSSDPPMNWRVSQLDRFSVLSFSDLHSFWPWRIGREATRFSMPSESYKDLLTAIRQNRIEGTVEVDPNYGKYHFDGHRNCEVRMSPAASAKAGGICPVCRKPLTIGVLARVEELADRPEDVDVRGRPGFDTLLPLSELIATVRGCGVATKSVWSSYNALIEAFGSEYTVLLKTPEEELSRHAGTAMSQAIMKNRSGDIEVSPGYDGEYGVPKLRSGKPDHSVRSDDAVEDEDNISEEKDMRPGTCIQRSLTDF